MLSLQLTNILVAICFISADAVYYTVELSRDKAEQF